MKQYKTVIFVKSNPDRSHTTYIHNEIKYAEDILNNNEAMAK